MRAVDSKDRFDVPDNWLERVTGVREKRLTPEGILPSDMAVIAAREAMDRAAVTASEIDAIIYTGLIRDHLEPATAHRVQAKLYASNAVVFDITNACHGFMNGIHLMDGLIATGQVRRGLVVTGEQGKLFTKRAIDILKTTDKRETLIALAAGLTLGDAGAAFLMGPKLSPDSGFMGFMLQSHGQHSDLCVSGAPLTEGPLITDMPKIVSESSRLVTALFNEFFYQKLQWRVEDLAKYVLHQVGGKIYNLHFQLMGIPLQIMHRSVDTLGNLITANIPMSINEFYVNNEVKNDDKIYMSGTGSGISLSQTGLIWDAA